LRQVGFLSFPPGVVKDFYLDPAAGLQQHVEKVSFAGCSKMPRCKASEILRREAYFLVH
jgi:hypothetical protein